MSSMSKGISVVPQHWLYAAITAPHDVEFPFCPMRWYFPTSPSSVTPTCGPKRISTLPSSGTWCENAMKPVLPTKGAPPMPPSGKTSPQYSFIRSARSPFSLLISSEQMLWP